MIKVTSSANIYANALIETNLACDTVLHDLKLVKDAVNTSQLEEIISNPSISLDIKKELINDVFNDKINQEILNFIVFISEKRRFSQLDEIIQSYSDKVDEINNIKRALIISAVDLSDEQKERVVEKLNKKFNKTIIAEYNTDKSIIGGLIIKIDDDVIDNSLKNKLDKLNIEVNYGTYTT